MPEHITSRTGATYRNWVKSTGRPSYITPWQMQGQANYEGSGCIIEGGLILTNAHVVSNHTFITVKRSGQTKKYVAKIKYIAHACDLAVLEVKDPSFYPALPPLELGNLPLVGDEVAVYGFPSFAEQLTLTKGIVSRVSHERYAHSSANLLGCQIDAPINDGNSGGPVIKDKKVVGIAMMAGWGENEGYMVSIPVIEHFLDDISDESYDGIPTLGIHLQTIESPSMRQYYGMDEDQTGLLVRKLYPGSPANRVLRPGDVVLSIDGEEIANDGTINFRGDERTYYLYYVQNKQLNETVRLKVLRDGQVREVPITLTMLSGGHRLVPYEIYDQEPSYYIYGGFIFSPLTENFLLEFENEWDNYIPGNLSYAASYRGPTAEKQGVIIIVDVLSDEVNMGYEDMYWEIVDSVNGRKIGSLRHLVKAIESSKAPFQVIETEGGDQILLDRREAKKSTRRILKLYRIPSDRSENLKRKLIISSD